MTEKLASVGWNTWHGCTKVSAGCKNCYVYMGDYKRGVEARSFTPAKNANFNLPMQRKRNGDFKIAPGTLVYTCFTSDLLLAEADEWRTDVWAMMKYRHDLTFMFFTKRVERFLDVLPPDWGTGYDNVVVGCSVENQAMAERRLPVFNALPIKHKIIVAAPLIGPIDIEPFLNGSIEEVSVGGESGYEARACDFDWVLGIREQCVRCDVPFSFHQTGACLVKNGNTYHIARRFQRIQAVKAGINYRIGDGGIPVLGDKRDDFG